MIGDYDMSKTEVCFVQIPYGFYTATIPAALGILKSVVKKAGYESTIIDLNSNMLNEDQYYVRYNPERARAVNANSYDRFLEQIDKEFLEKLDEGALKILAKKAQVLAFSVYFRAALWSGIYLAKRIKESSSSLIIAGGAAFDMSVVQFLGRVTPSDSIDLYCVGEGESVLVSLLDAIPPTSNYCKQGFAREIAGRTSGVGVPEYGIGMNINSLAPLPNILDNLPYADFDGYKLAKEKILSLTLARSCNAACTFCSSRKTHNSFRMLSGKRATDEMIYLSEKYGIYNFYFSAPLCNGDLDKFRDMCRAIIDSSKTFNLSGLIRLDKRMTYNDLELMHRAGFHRVGMALESGSPKVRKSMGKLPDQDFCKSFIKQTSAIGITVITNIMHSFPTEDDEAFQETIEFLDAFSAHELEWNAWPFSLGFTANLAVDYDFIKRFNIRLLKNLGIEEGIPNFSLDLRWENALINDDIRAKREELMTAFRKKWLSKEENVKN